MTDCQRAARRLQHADLDPLYQVKSLIAGPEGLPLVIHAYRMEKNPQGGGQVRKFSNKIYRGDKLYKLPPQILAGEFSKWPVADDSGASMERALDRLMSQQQRWFAKQAAFEQWAEWCLDQSRLLRIQKECQIGRLRGAVRQLRSFTLEMSAEQQRVQASQAMSERFRRERLRFWRLRLLNRWHFLTNCNKIGDDVIQRCLVPRTLFQASRNEDLLPTAFGAWVCYLERQNFTAILLRSSNRKFRRLRTREALCHWAGGAREQRAAERRHQRVAMSCAWRVQRHIYTAMTRCVREWGLWVATRRKAAANNSCIRSRRNMAVKRSIFCAWERTLRSTLLRKEVRKTFHGEAEALQLELEVLRREVEESRLAREHTENELFHTQEALSKAMLASRKLEDHRHAADEDLYLKLEQYRLETQRVQADYGESQAEVQRLRSSLRQALEDSSSENEKHVLSRELLTRRTLAAEEALHTLRRSLPLLSADDQGVGEGVGQFGEGVGQYLSKSQLAGSIQRLQGPEATDFERRVGGHAAEEEGVLGSGLVSPDVLRLWVGFIRAMFMSPFAIMYPINIRLSNN